MSGELVVRMAEKRSLGLEVLRTLERVAHRLGATDFYTPAWEAANAALRQDPADGSMALVLEWRDAAGYKNGEMVFNADGSLYAECDVLRAHPSDERWFVEAVTAWGCEGAIHGEPRLLQAV